MIIRQEAMVDIETLSLEPNAMIVSLGAVLFSKEGVDDQNIFYETIDIVQAQKDHGDKFHIDAGTVTWWTSQSAASRAVFSTRKEKIEIVLSRFANWLKSWNVNGIWGNGSDYDNVVLAQAYRTCGLTLPWKFGKNRCYRTLKNLCPSIPLERIGEHHNALDDAKSQAAHAVQIMRKLGI